MEAVPPSIADSRGHPHDTGGGFTNGRPNAGVRSSVEYCWFLVNHSRWRCPVGIFPGMAPLRCGARRTTPRRLASRSLSGGPAAAPPDCDRAGRRIISGVVHAAALQFLLPTPMPVSASPQTQARAAASLHSPESRSLVDRGISIPRYRPSYRHQRRSGLLLPLRTKPSCRTQRVPSPVAAANGPRASG